ncbi:MAG: hypothetical protein OXE53_06225 [Deltaproteobacteria bacterium]|nr:hypothetical protein [Deltaproteobacteria bacterium]
MALIEEERNLPMAIMLTRDQRDELDNLVKLAGGELSRSRVARVALTEGMGQVRRRLIAAEA